MQTTVMTPTRRAMLAGVGAASVAPQALAQSNIRWITLDADAEHVRFPGAVNNHPVSLMLDSGAGNFVIDSTFARRIGIASTGAAMQAQGLVGAREVQVSGPFVINFAGINLSVGGAAMIDLSAVALTGQPIPVLLGAGFLQSMVVEIDFAARRFGIHRPGSFTPGDGKKVPLRRAAGGMRHIEVSIEGRAPIWATFDIGSSSALSLDGQYARGAGLHDGRPASTWISAQLEDIVTYDVTTARFIEIGGVRIADVEVDSHPVWNPGHGAPANVGISLIRRLGRVVIDYKSDALYVYPTAASPPPPSKDTLGLALSPLEGGGWRVLHVAAGSPGANAGWKTGEMIASLNGRTSGRDERDGQPGARVDFVMADGSARSLVRAIYY